MQSSIPLISEWMKLKDRCPPSLDPLIFYCIRYTDIRTQLLENSHMSDQLFGELNSVLQTIVSEYKRVLQLTMNTKTLTDVDADIKKILTRMMSPQGRIEIDVAGYNKARKEGWIGTYISTYIATFDSFINGRIYSVLKQVFINDLPDEILKKFTYRTSKMAGIFPQFNQDKKSFEEPAAPAMDGGG